MARAILEGTGSISAWGITVQTLGGRGTGTQGRAGTGVANRVWGPVNVARFRGQKKMEAVHQTLQ